MASELSGKAKLGRAIALLGGAIGVGIIIYALMGQAPKTSQIDGDQPNSENAGTVQATTPDGSDGATETTGTDASQTEIANNVETPAETETETTGTETTETETITTETTDTGNAASETKDTGTATTETTETPTTGTATTNTETTATETAGPETTEIATPHGDTSAEATASDTSTESAPEPQTEIASVAQPNVAQTDDATGTAGQSDSTGTAPTLSQSDAPVVATDDPVMPGAEPVTLQSATGPTESGPRLDPSDPAVPKFDLVRIEADGATVIAGRASPNAEVQILSNGEEIGTATASSRGEFVALIDTEIATTAQSLALIADAPETGRVASQSNVIVLARTATEIDNLDEEISLAPAIVQATPDAVRVIQPVVGLADLDRVSLDTISYDEAGQVILAGRGRPGFIARVYADGRSISDSKISGSGTWSAMIDNLDEGRYVIRVDEINPSGDVASRVESPFQRIFPTAEQLALLSDATSVIVQPGNNLWTIAEGKYGEGFRYTTIFEANKEQIRDPDLIYPGQVFDLPEERAE